MTEHEAQDSPISRPDPFRAALREALGVPRYVLDFSDDGKATLRTGSAVYEEVEDDE